MIWYIVLICSLVFVGGHPVHEEESAFDHIDQSNKELPEEMKAMLKEGDIMSPPNAAVVKTRGQWPNGIIPFTISSVFGSTDKTKIRNAVREIMRVAPCLNFKEYTYSSSGIPSDHVEVFKSGGCWSYVGKTGGKQSLSLGNGCVYQGTIIHEFLHAIGFYHEQSRPDRDNYVRINRGNIRGGMEHNFDMAKNINSLGVSYDEKSVMHYSNHAFSSNGKPTLEWKNDPSVRLGGNVLTDKDIKQINLKYCDGTKPPTTTTTTTQPPPPPTTSTTTTYQPPPTTSSTTTYRPPPTSSSSTPWTTRSTTSTDTMTTTNPPTGACGDKEGNCISIQFQRYRCSYNQKKMCPRSCKVCQGPESEMCLNFQDKSGDCYEKAKRGDCQHRKSYIRWQTKLNCPRTCCERGALYKYPKY